MYDIIFYLKHIINITINGLTCNKLGPLKEKLKNFFLM